MPNCLSWTSSRSTASSQAGGFFDVTLIDERPGMVIFHVAGDGAAEAFKDESGGHRWQRVPPTEHSGRVHTSTITVAVLPEPETCSLAINDCDLKWETRRGSGPGGQNRNKLESAITLTHKPTGTVVRCETERSQFRNKQLALEVLRSRIQANIENHSHESRSAERKTQIGSGMRGDKRRTIRVRDNSVKDHLTGSMWRFTEYAAGKWA